MNARRKRRKLELEHIPVSIVRLLCVCPSPENEQIYKSVRDDDPDVLELAESIKKYGLRTPLVITKDGFIISGHRRRVAAWLAGLRAVPCQRLNIVRADPEFVPLLREYNRQRVKTREEHLREEIISVNPEEAHQSLIRHREQAARIRTETIELREEQFRCEISAAKKPLLDAVLQIIERLADFWPLSDRQIHYQLLNDPPLIHGAKPTSTYRNDLPSYKALSDLLTRARHAGLIEYDVIADSTRPVTTWAVHDNVREYLRGKLRSLLADYWRNLGQSQTNHIEIVGEKLTIVGIIKPVAAHYCIPVTIGRGYCSTRPKHDIAERFRKSGKERLVLLIISDFDPDGDEIAHSLARSLRDDFEISNIDAIKVALRAEQVSELELPPSMIAAKRTSANYKRFINRYACDKVYELEALPPQILQNLLKEAIRSVLDIEAFNAEIESEKEDAVFLSGLRKRMLAVLPESA